MDFDDPDVRTEGEVAPADFERPQGLLEAPHQVEADPHFDRAKAGYLLRQFVDLNDHAIDEFVRSRRPPGDTE